MTPFIEKLIELASKNWRTPKGLVLFIALVLLALSGLLYKYDILYIFDITTVERTNKITFNELIILFLGVSISSLFWLIQATVPKNKKDTVGIVIAIVTENENEKIKLKNDFVSNLQEKLMAENMQNTFKIIEYPEVFASEVNQSNVTKYMKKSRAHFFVYGSLKKRYHEGKEQYFFHLNMGVRHGPIPVTISKTFSEEMNQVSPRRIRFYVENEFEGFEITSNWAALAIEYIIGVAAFLTGDLKFSSDLHHKLFKELEKIKTNLPAIKTLKEKNKMRLTESLFQLQKIKYFLFRRNGRKELLDEISAILEKLKYIEPRNYAASISRAILYFLRDRDINTSLKELKNAQYKPDDTWRYSEAFLYAYRGDMDKAIKSYKKAFHGFTQPHVPEESEEFIHDILKLEPDKYQLWFCLGLINFFAKEDMNLAAEDFNRFLADGNENEFAELRRLAKEYLKQIKL